VWQVNVQVGTALGRGAYLAAGQSNSPRLHRPYRQREDVRPTPVQEFAAVTRMSDRSSVSPDDDVRGVLRPPVPALSTSSRRLPLVLENAMRQTVCSNYSIGLVLGCMLAIGWCSALFAQSVSVSDGTFKELSDQILDDGLLIHDRQLFIDDYVIEELAGA